MSVIAPNTACAVLVDYDNFFVGPLGTDDEIRTSLLRMVQMAVDADHSLDDVWIRLYGGWLEEGLLTARASQLQAAISRSIFPFPHPYGSGLVRGSVTLVTRLESVPGWEWAHTHRTKRGLPRLRLAETPRPTGCANAGNCPIDLVQRMSRRASRVCHDESCAVSNADAFVIREQKMVDSMICCDVLAFASDGPFAGRPANVMVLSDDLDILPAIAMAASGTSRLVTLVRSSAEVDSLYDTEMGAHGIHDRIWELT